ncbi:MAG: hypothetical protein WA604_13275, partial [Candidatus Sulfotelmatobacter sp.]
APVSPAATPRAKGSREGITVSGQWVIEVRNPDGKVTAHREFENAIQPAGMAYLAALLAGNNAPGQLSIMLNGANSDFQAAANANVTPVFFVPTQSTCGAPSLSPPFANIDGVSFEFGLETDGAGPCIITAAANSSSYGSLLSAACAYYSAQGLPFCSTNLTATAPTITTSNFGNLSASFTLGGKVLANFPTNYPVYILDVETIFETCSNGSTPAGCTGFWDSKTGKPKPGMTWEGMNFFTEATLPSPGIAYTPGQTIAATVTFTFSSPSS